MQQGKVKLRIKEGLSPTSPICSNLRKSRAKSLFLNEFFRGSPIRVQNPNLAEKLETSREVGKIFRTPAAGGYAAQALQLHAKIVSPFKRD